MATIDVSSGSTYSNYWPASDTITVFAGGIVTLAFLTGVGTEVVSSGGVVRGCPDLC